MRRATQCGTNSGHSRHISRRERPCDPCRLAHNAYRREEVRRRDPARKPVSENFPCGTLPAAKRHYKWGEEPCEPCKEVLRRDANERHARKRAVRPPKPSRALTCPTCQTPFHTTNIQQVYCSPMCRARRWKSTVRTSWLQRQRERQAARPTGHRWRMLRAAVLAEETDCWLCGRHVDRSFRYPHRLSASVDHVVPLACGGDPYDRSNLRLACLECNKRRGSFAEIEVMSGASSPEGPR